MLLPVFAMAPQLTDVSEASLHGEPLICRLFYTSEVLAGEADGLLRGCQGEKESDCQS